MRFGVLPAHTHTHLCLSIRGKTEHYEWVCACGCMCLHVEHARVCVYFCMHCMHYIRTFACVYLYARMYINIL